MQTLGTRTLGNQLKNKFREGKYDEVLHLSKGIDDSYFHYLRGRSYERKGDMENALIEFKKSIKPGETCCNFNRVLGDFYTKTAKRMADKESPEYVEALNNALMCLKEAERLQLRYGTDDFPNRTWNSIADIYSLKGDMTKAHEYYNQGIREDKNDWYGYNGKADLYLGQGKLVEAKEYFEKAYAEMEKTKKKCSQREKVLEMNETLTQLKNKIEQCILGEAAEGVLEKTRSKIPMD